MIDDDDNDDDHDDDNDDDHDDHENDDDDVNDDCADDDDVNDDCADDDDVNDDCADDDDNDTYSGLRLPNWQISNLIVVLVICIIIQTTRNSIQIDFRITILKQKIKVLYKFWNILKMF